MRFASLMGLAAGLFAQTTRLELGKTMSGDLSGAYLIALDANQYLRAVVTQPFAYALIELYAPDGKKVLEMDIRNFHKPSRIVFNGS